MVVVYSAGMVVAGLVVADLVAVVPVRAVWIGYTAPARIRSRAAVVYSTGMVVAGLVVADLVAVVPVRAVWIGYTAPARIRSRAAVVYSTGMVVVGLVVADLVVVVPVRVVWIGYTAPARTLSLVRSLCRSCSPHGRFHLHLLSSCYRPARLLVLRIGFESDSGFDLGPDTSPIHVIFPFVCLFVC